MKRWSSFVLVLLLFPIIFHAYALAAPKAQISGISLSGTTFVGGSPSGTTIGTISVQQTAGMFCGSLSLSDNTHFQIVNSNTLVTKGSDAAGTYVLTITARSTCGNRQVTNSPYSHTFSIVGTQPTTPTITGVSLSGTTIAGGSPAGTTIGVISVQETNGTFTGTLSISDNANFQIINGATLASKIPLQGGTSYSLTITATQQGAMGSPFPQSFTITVTGTPTIYDISLGTTTSFLGGSANGTTIGSISVLEQNGTFSGAITISDTTHFQLSGAGCTTGGGTCTLQTKGTDNPGTYPLTITATQSGVSGSPFTKSFTITGTGITGISLSNTQFVGGSVSGTFIGTISATEVGGTFAGSFSLSGADAASFAISGGNNLVTSGRVAAGTYAITITATQSGVGGSPFPQNFALMASSSGSQQWFFMTSNGTFSPSDHGLTQGSAITVETVGGGGGGWGSGACSGAYAHQSGASYSLTASDISSGLTVRVGAAGVAGSSQTAGGSSYVLNGSAAEIVGAEGGGIAPCNAAQVIVGTGYPGGLNGGYNGAGSGGAGSAGPHGPGGNGASAGSYGGGGGGAADGGGNAPAAPTNGNGGNGGGAQGGAGGVANTTPGAGGAGANGGGGGGGGMTTSGTTNGGPGGLSGMVCPWDNAHCLGGGPGGGGKAATGTGGNAGLPRGYGCGGAGSAINASFANQGTPSAGCPGLVVIGWVGGAPAQSIQSVTLTGQTYAVNAAANTQIGTVAIAMNPSAPGFSGTISVDDTTHFKIASVNGVPTLEANATLSASSYPIKLTATQSGISNSPFQTSTITLSARTLSLTVTPSAPSITSATPLGASVAVLQGVWNDASTFSGSYFLTAPYYGNNNKFVVSGNQLIINPSGPGVGFDAGMTQNAAVIVTDGGPPPIFTTADGTTLSVSQSQVGLTITDPSGNVWNFGAANGPPGNYWILLNGAIADSGFGSILEIKNNNIYVLGADFSTWWMWLGYWSAINGTP